MRGIEIQGKNYRDEREMRGTEIQGKNYRDEREGEIRGIETVNFTKYFMIRE